MKRNPDFMLRDVAGKPVLVPLGKAATAFPGMITVNPAGRFIWELLETPHTLEEVVQAMTDRYQVSEEIAAADAKLFLDRLKSVQAVIE